MNASGASKSDSKDVSTYSHMFGCWETMFAIREAVEQSGYRNKRDYPALIETMEGFTGFNEGIAHPQGPKVFNGKNHQCYGNQFISKVAGGKLNVVHRTSFEDGMYDSDVDYTKMSL